MAPVELVRMEPVPARAPRRRRGRALAALGAVLAVAGLASWLTPAPGEDAEDLALGARLAVPLEVPLPPDAVVTTDGGYVALRLEDGRSEVTVRVPTQVATVSGGGSRVALPRDPAQWLQAHPSVTVTRVAFVRVSGRLGTQVDYRMSAAAAAAAEAGGPAGVPLFCGWRPGPDPRLPGGGSPCTVLTSERRMRTTFMQVDARTVMLEATWPSDASLWARTPVVVRRGYGLVLGRMRVAGDPPAYDFDVFP